MDAPKVENMYKSLENLEVLRGVPLHVTESEVLAILGPSDSGESALLRCAIFLDCMDSGHIEYLGQTTLTKEDGVKTSKGDEKRFHHDCGLVFQNFNLFSHWAMIRNLCNAPIKVQRRPPEGVRVKAKRLLERISPPDKGGACPSELSDGQKQRVVIARALALHPRILYFDEPTSALDPELTGGILAIIRSLAGEQVTMVIVTHGMEFAAGVADRAVFMDGGTVLEEGATNELIHHPTQERTKQFLSRLRGEARSY